MTASKDLLANRLQEFVLDLTAQKPIVQAILALETGDTSFRWIGTTGVTASGEGHVAEDTPFFLASIDKLYNATIAMLLSEMGRLNLDESISTYLADSVTRGLHRLDGIDHSGSITVRHLLSHASGLADWLEDQPRGGRSLFDRVLEEGDRMLSIDEIAAFVRDQLRPHFPPQDLTLRRPKVRYCDTNFMLLIAIIESLTGEPLHKIHQRLLYEPLELRHTYFPGLSQPLDPTPDPMSLRANGQPLQIPLLMRSVRGIYSTARDAMSFMRRLVLGEIFEYPATFASMNSNWHQFGFPLDRAALRSPGWPIEYGLGMMRFHPPRIFSLMRSLPAVVGHTGSTGCWLFWCPEWDIYLAGSVDEVTAGAIPYRLVPKMLKMLRPLQ